MAELAAVAEPEHRATVVEHADALAEAALEHLSLERDREAMQSAHRRVAEAAEATPL
jgi:hypothetical protein